MRYRCHRCETVHKAEPAECRRCGATVFNREFPTRFGEEFYWLSRKLRWGTKLGVARIFQLGGFGLLLYGAYDLLRRALAVPAFVSSEVLEAALIDSALASIGLMAVGAALVWVFTAEN